VGEVAVYECWLGLCIECYAVSSGMNVLFGIGARVFDFQVVQSVMTLSNWRSTCCTVLQSLCADTT